MKKSSLVIISNNLKRIRGARGVTQIELAQKVKLSRFTYSNIENGKVVPKANDLQRIADALGVSIGKLVSPVPKILRLRFRI